MLKSTPLTRLLATKPLLLALLLVAGCGSSEPAVPAGPPKHVVLIVVDTLRADHLSCYGYWRETSPNIDALAARGAKFTQAISPSSWTAPSMVTMMTGRRVAGPYLHVPIHQPVMAEMFKSAGYQTGAWIANELLNYEMGFARGFDHFVDEEAWHSSTPPGNLRGIIEWMNENKDRDSFAWIHFTDPHDPYTPALDLRSGELGRISPYQAGIINDAANAHSIPADVEGQTAFIASETGLYDDEIRTVDRKIRRLMVAMKEAGILDDAIIAITSDHGECLWQRTESQYRFDSKAKGRVKRNETVTVKHILKQTHGDFIYQELVNVPMIIVAPGIAPGTVIDTVVEAVNLPATLMELAGIDVDGMQEFAGKNMFGDEVLPGAYTMTSHVEAFVSVDGWKLIRPTESGASDFGQVLALYNLNEDPGEQNNLAAQFPERVTELSGRMGERRDSALPNLPPAELQRQMDNNVDALTKLGYADGGIMDPEQDSE